MSRDELIALAKACVDDTVLARAFLKADAERERLRASHESVHTAAAALGRECERTRLERDEAYAERDIARAEVEELEKLAKLRQDHIVSLSEETFLYHEELKRLRPLQAELSALRAEIAEGMVVYSAQSRPQRRQVWKTFEAEGDTHRARLVRIEKIGEKP